MPTKRPPKDANELASYILRVTVGDEEKIEPPKKNAHMKALSAKGAHKGGRVRAKNLSAKKRKAIAQKAAKTRWAKSKH